MTDTPVTDTINVIEKSLMEAMLGISPQERTRITLDITAALRTAGLLKTLQIASVVRGRDADLITEWIDENERYDFVQVIDGGWVGKPQQTI